MFIARIFAIVCALLALSSAAHATATITPFPARVAPTGSPPGVVFTLNTTDPAAPNGQVGYSIGDQLVTGCEQAVSVPANAVNFQVVMHCAYTGPVTPYYYDGATYYVPCSGAPQWNCPIANRIVTWVDPWPTTGPRAYLSSPVTYTIDPVNGQDFNVGTPLAPFRTMQRCADKVTYELDVAGVRNAATCQSVPGQVYTNSGILVGAAAVGQRLTEDIVFDWNGSTCFASKGLAYGCVETGNWGQKSYPYGQLASPRFAIRRVKLKGNRGTYGIAGNGGIIIGLDGVECADFADNGVCLTMEGPGGAVIFLYTTLDVSGGGQALSMSFVGGNIVIQETLVNFKNCAPTGTATCGNDGKPILPLGMSSVGGGQGGWSWFYGGSNTFTGYYNGVTQTVYPGGYATNLGSAVPAVWGAGACQKGGFLNNLPCP